MNPTSGGLCIIHKSSIEIPILLSQKDQWQILRKHFWNPRSCISNGPTLLSLLCGQGLLGSMALRVKGPALPKPLSTLAPCNLGISSLATSLRAGD